MDYVATWVFDDVWLFDSGSHGQLVKRSAAEGKSDPETCIIVDGCLPCVSARIYSTQVNFNSTFNLGRGELGGPVEAHQPVHLIVLGE